MSRFGGDPKLILGPNGSRLQWSGGQCLMDQGVENAVQISLLTEPDWWGNSIEDNPNRRIGSNYLKETRKTITANSIPNIDKAAVAALNDPLFGEVTSEAVNTEAYRIDNLIGIKPPGSDQQQLLINKNGANWINQKLNPANRQVINGS
jgi:phage gp46-like protein